MGAARHSADLPRRIVVERLGQVVAGARQIVGQRGEPRGGIIGEALHRPIAERHAAAAAKSELWGYVHVSP